MEASGRFIILFRGHYNPAKTLSSRAREKIHD